jgi:hypothetical protein
LRWRRAGDSSVFASETARQRSDEAIGVDFRRRMEMG